MTDGLPGGGGYPGPSPKSQFFSFGALPRIFLHFFGKFLPKKCLFKTFPPPRTRDLTPSTCLLTEPWPSRCVLRTGNHKIGVFTCGLEHTLFPQNTVCLFCLRQGRRPLNWGRRLLLPPMHPIGEDESCKQPCMKDDHLAGKNTHISGHLPFSTPGAPMNDRLTAKKKTNEGEKTRGNRSSTTIHMPTGTGNRTKQACRWYVEGPGLGQAKQLQQQQQQRTEGRQYQVSVEWDNEKFGAHRWIADRSSCLKDNAKERVVMIPTLVSFPYAFVLLVCSSLLFWYLAEK